MTGYIWITNYTLYDFVFGCLFDVCLPNNEYIASWTNRPLTIVLVDKRSFCIYFPTTTKHICSMWLVHDTNIGQLVNFFFQKHQQQKQITSDTISVSTLHSTITIHMVECSTKIHISTHETINKNGSRLINAAQKIIFKIKFSFTIASVCSSTSSVLPHSLRVADNVSRQLICITCRRYASRSYILLPKLRAYRGYKLYRLFMITPKNPSRMKSIK